MAKGGDPAQARHEKRRREKATLGALLAVDGPYERSLRDRGVVSVNDIMFRLRRGLMPLMQANIARLTRLEWIETFDRLRGFPGAQTELRKSVRTLLEWTTNSGLTPANVMAGYRRPPKTRTQKIEAAAKRRELRDSGHRRDVARGRGGTRRAG